MSPDEGRPGEENLRAAGSEARQNSEVRSIPLGGISQAAPPLGEEADLCRRAGVLTATLTQWFDGCRPSGYVSTLRLRSGSHPPRTDWYALDDLDKAGRESAHYANTTWNVFTGMAPRDRRLPDGRRGKAEDVAEVPGLWADLDGAWGVHKARNLPASVEEVEAALAGFPISPTALISSGGGVYALWKFRQPVSQDLWRPEAKKLDAALGEIWDEHGWHLDAGVVDDAARVLRFPGTINRKGAPIEVTMLSADWGRTYDLREIADALPNLAPRSKTRGTGRGAPLLDAENITPVGAEEVDHWIQEHTSGWEDRLRDEFAQRTTELASQDSDRHDTALSIIGSAVARAALGRGVDLVNVIIDTAEAMAEACQGEDRDTQREVNEIVRWVVSKEVTSGAADGEVIAALRKGIDGTEPPAKVGLRAGSGSRFFNLNGLKVVKLAREVLRAGPLAVGTDHDLWCYRDGVWVPGETEVQKRVVRLLGERTRNSHHTNVRLVLTSIGLPTIDCGPVEQYINFANGLLDWKPGMLVGHNPQVLSTVQFPWNYRPEAECPVIDGWLRSVLPLDCVEEFIWELVGYLMLSGNPLHKAMMLDGTGRNGKGTFLRLIGLLLGQHNVASVPLQTLSDDRFATADLFGKVANIAGDLDAKRVNDTSAFKMMTGGDPIRAQRKFGHGFTFTTWAVPIFSANKIPGSADPSEGYLRRWIVVPFPRRLTEAETAIFDEDAMHGREELEGFAAKGVAGLRRLMRRGRFDFPPSVRDAYDGFVSEVDHVRSYIVERCEVIPGEWTPRRDLFTDYQFWGAEEGRDHLLTASSFYERVRGAGYSQTKRRGDRGFNALVLKVRDT